GPSTARKPSTINCAQKPSQAPKPASSVDTAFDWFISRPAPPLCKSPAGRLYRETAKGRRIAMTASIRLRRSVLFLPGSNQRAIDKARTLPADGVIFDLEDAVAPEAKDEASAGGASPLRSGGYP